MLKPALLLGGVLLYVLAARRGPLQDIITSLIVLSVAIAFLAADLLVWLLPLLPRLVPSAFIQGFLGLLGGG